MRRIPFPVKADMWVAWTCLWVEEYPLNAIDRYVRRPVARAASLRIREATENLRRHVTKRGIDEWWHKELQEAREQQLAHQIALVKEEREALANERLRHRRADQALLRGSFWPHGTQSPGYWEMRAIIASGLACDSGLKLVVASRAEYEGWLQEARPGALTAAFPPVRVDPLLPPGTWELRAVIEEAADD